MKPFSIIYFICLIFLLLFLLMIFIPKGGLILSEDIKLNFPSASNFFIKDIIPKGNVPFILEDLNEEKSILTSYSDGDTLNGTLRDSLRKSLLGIQYPAGDKSILYGFFAKLKTGASDGSQTRIMHYGDSQIEGDRITGLIRNELQKRFKGNGPGLFPLIPVAPKAWSNNSYSSNWKRYTGFGKKDSLVNHNNYGALLNFSRFTEIKEDSINKDTATHEAWIEIVPSNKSYPKASVFNEVTMYYDHCTAPVFLHVFKDNKLFKEEALSISRNISQYKIAFESPASSIKFIFKTKISPNILGFSISSGSGVIIDNIPLRGGSGTEFSSINRKHIAEMLEMLQPDLFIMQFGGNVLPYLESDKKCQDYCDWLESNLRMVKKMIPGSALILIGPADMSVKMENEFITHPYLEKLRDGLKKAAFNSGSAYWDMYQAMGGKNAMPLWVNANPPLASKDYIHFTSEGARKIAELFFESFYEDYKLWEQNHKNEKKNL